mgnify:CR=1 FL=1
MSIQVDCVCGKRFFVPDTAAGKSGKCAACGAGLIVPYPPVADEEEEAALPLPPRSTPPPPPLLPPPVPTPPAAVVVAPSPAEASPLPWYFGACRFFAWFLVMVSVFGFVLSFMAFADPKNVGPGIVTFWGGCLGSFVSGAFWLAILDGLAALVRGR